MATEVGAPLLVKVAVLSGTSGLELQLVPSVHSVPGPVQAPSTCAYTAPGASVASAANGTPAGSAARGSVPALAVAWHNPVDRQRCRVPVTPKSPALGRSTFKVLVSPPLPNMTPLSRCKCGLQRTSGCFPLQSCYDAHNSFTASRASPHRPRAAAPA